MTDRICVAQIGAAHGIRGEVRLRSFTQDPMAVAAYGPLESEDGTRRFEIEALRPAKDHFVARLDGVADRNAAEKLTNLKLYVSRDRLPPIEDDETFYHADLVGLAAVTPDGAALGTVTAVHNFGAGDLVEIKPRAAASRMLVPFTETAVPEIDIAGAAHGRRAARPTTRVTDDVARHRPHDVPRDVSGTAGPEPRRQGAGVGPLVARRASTSARTRPTGTAPSTTRRPAAGPAW